MIKRIKVIAFLGLFFTSWPASSQWLCHEVGSMREENRITSCGVGHGINEASARQNALKNAYQELDSICNRSGDCKNNELIIDPLRNECVKDDDGFKCYRGIMAIITTMKRKQTKRDQSVGAENMKDYLKACDNHDVATELLKKNKYKQASLKMREIPFNDLCAKQHYEFMNTLSKLNKYPQDYTDYLFSLISTFKNGPSDWRTNIVLEFLHEKGDWNTREWKKIYHMTTQATPNEFWGLINILFHLNSSNQKREKARIRGMITDIENGRIGFPEKVDISNSLSRFIRLARDENDFWFIKVVQSNTFKNAAKLKHGRMILDSLEQLFKFNLSDSQYKKVIDWMGGVFEKGEDIHEMRDFILRFSRKLKNDLDKLDNTIRKEEFLKKKVEKRRELFLSKVRLNVDKFFSDINADLYRKRVIEFCLKEGLPCQVIPSRASLEKRLSSDKSETVENAVYYLTYMPNISFDLKDKLLNILQGSRKFKLRELCITALVETPIKEKKDLDIILMHSLDRVYDYRDLVQKLGKRLLVSLIPIASDHTHREQKYGIKMIGLIGQDAQEASSVLKKILEESTSKYILQEARTALARVSKKK